MSPQNRRFVSRRAVLLAATMLWMAGCNTQVAPPPPTPSPSPSVSALPSAGPSTPTATAMLFREDFNGTVVDESRWKVFRQSGVVAIQDDKLEMLNSNGKPDFPYVLTHSDVIPTTGPFFLEVGYIYITSGAISFCLDYLPAEDPADRPLSEPFMLTYLTNQGLRFRFATETRDLFVTAAKGATLKTPHVLRIECDGNRQYRVIVDGAEVGKFESSRRPTRFWMGYPKNAPVPASWARVQVDYVEAGTLLAPASATPLATPTPEGSPEPDASASPAA